MRVFSSSWKERKHFQKLWMWISSSLIYSMKMISSRRPGCDLGSWVWWTLSCVDTGQGGTLWVCFRQETFTSVALSSITLDICLSLSLRVALRHSKGRRWRVFVSFQSELMDGTNKNNLDGNNVNDDCQNSIICSCFSFCILLHVTLVQTPSCNSVQTSLCLFMFEIKEGKKV